ncbi:ATP-binding cassette domain-containing protein [Uliginosibacterium sp. sgz301328]|uniref:ATP-binding cassette domain-containing protein n=1 Tax=Uliginosibacterium sp. sgz301328 TaxID=3243764 RepID=UPI00359DD222
MIQFRNLALARGTRRLIEGLSLQIHPGWRVGVTGANGTGKSSLFALLRGELHQDAGDLEMPASWVIAHVAQETPALATSALDYVLDGDAELRYIQQELTAAEEAHDGHRVGELHARLQEIDGYAAQARASILLHGLGFADSDFTRPVSDFSGGWRMRLNLAQALMCRSDLLLLDEPTNHLDLDAVVWLERWLAAYRGTLLLISHDRDFLDACVTHIAHLDRQRLTLYAGNYSAFEDQHAAQLAQQQAMYEKQQRQIAHLHSYIDRFRAKATKARQAQSRIKALDRMEHIAAAHVDTPFDFSFLAPERAPDPLITLHDAVIGYGERRVIDGLSLTLRPGARLGLLGPNGAGKSTLIKLLAGELGAQEGQALSGKGLTIGYFAQHQLEQLRPDESPIQHLQRQEPTTREQDLRDYIGGFDFRGPMADAAIGPFSGGEKSRLALALLIRQRPNLLLLDEPTNHLDLDMRHALTVALAEYEGSMVLVSHDRALLRTVCNDFLLVADGKAEPFDGDLDDYLVWLDARRSKQADAAGDTQAAQDKAARQQARADAAADRQARLARRRPLAKEIEQIEKKLAGWQGEKKLLDARLSDPTLYANGDSAQLQTFLKRQAELTNAIDEAEMRWLEVQAELEEIGDI